MINGTFFSNITVYPQNQLHRGGYFMSLFDRTDLPYNRTFNHCTNTLCYTQSKGTRIYKPHSVSGMVGTSASSYLARRRRV